MPEGFASPIAQRSYAFVPLIKPINISRKESMERTQDDVGGNYHWQIERTDKVPSITMMSLRQSDDSGSSNHGPNASSSSE